MKFPITNLPSRREFYQIILSHTLGRGPNESLIKDHLRLEIQLLESTKIYYCFNSKGDDSNVYQRGTCIKGLFWPPPEPKTENCFSPISFDWFIRRINEV